MVLVGALLLTIGVVACGGESTPSAEDLRQAGEDLFTAISAAGETQDGPAFHDLLSAPTRERCTVEQLQDALESGDLNFPELEVKSVFLDLEDSERALVQANLRIQPEDDSLEGAATAIFAAFPFPMVLEQGRWRWDFLSFFSGLALSDDERCPFGSSVEESTAQAEVRPLPVEVHRLEPPRLEPPPGVRTRGGSSGKVRERPPRLCCWRRTPRWPSCWRTTVDRCWSLPR